MKITTTPLQKIEQENQNLDVALLHAHKMESIGQLASGVAHDFNNILMPILGFTDMALSSLEKNDIEKARIYLERVKKSANRAADLVDKMLIFCREKTIKTDTPISPTQVVEEVVEISKMLRASLSTTVTILLKNDLIETSPLVLIDASELHQLMTNLIVNARDAIEEYWANSSETWLRDTGKIIVSLTVKQFNPTDDGCDACKKPLDGEYVVISVTDTGSGIEPEKINRIFDPFFTTKEVGKGTGLGLSVVSGILHNVDAHIIVESQINHGTTFSLCFPAIENKMANLLAENANTETHFCPASPLRICVVDNEQDICDLFKQGLSNLGYEVESFHDSIEAWQCLMQSPNHFDALITDYGMPNMTGLDLAIAVLSVHPEFPILICTGYSAKLKTSDDLPQGNTFLFNKPVAIKTLDETLRNFFKTH